MKYQKMTMFLTKYLNSVSKPVKSK